MCVGISSCREGDTRDIFELVRAADLGISSFELEKSHEDNLRPGREIEIRALVFFEDGSELDVTNEVKWAVEDEDVIKSNGDGIFQALPVSQLTKTFVNADFSGLVASTEISVSIAPLKSLELGFALESVVDSFGADSKCQIDPTVTELNQCGAKRLCVLGAYEGESALREETLYVDFSSTGNSIFDLGYIINVQIDLESGDVLDQATANLDSIDSNSLDFSHKQDSSELIISSTSPNLIMGSSMQLEVENVPFQVIKYVTWSFNSFLLGQPEATGSFSGLEFTAGYENDYVEDFSKYGGDIQTSCSGKLSNQVQLLIESDVNQLIIIDSLANKEISIGSSSPTILTLEAIDVGGDDISIKNGEVSWFVCDFAQNPCEESHRQSDNGSVLSYISEPSAEPGQLRIEAVFHGKKAVREDFSLIVLEE